MIPDLTPEPDLDIVAEHSLTIVERLTDPRLYFELVNLCRSHPSKAAQVIMCLGAWHDGADPQTLAERAQYAANPEIDWRAVEWVVRERVRMPGLNHAERCEVIGALTGHLTDRQIGDLIEMSQHAVQQARLRSRRRAGVA